MFGGDARRVGALHGGGFLEGAVQYVLAVGGCGVSRVVSDSIVQGLLDEDDTEQQQENEGEQA